MARYPKELLPWLWSGHPFRDELIENRERVQKGEQPSPIAPLA